MAELDYVLSFMW